MSYLKQRQTTIFRQGGSPSSLLQERPGLFVPRGGNRSITIDSSAFLRTTARRRIPVHQHGRISSSAKPRYFARAATHRRFHKSGQAFSFLGGVIAQFRSTPALSCELQRVTADPTISGCRPKKRQNTIFRQGGDQSATPKEQPGPFDPHDGNRLISNNSGLHPCALGAVL